MKTSVTYFYDPKEYGWINNFASAEQECRECVQRSLWDVPVDFKRIPGMPLTAEIPGADHYNLMDAFQSFDWAFKARR